MRSIPATALLGSLVLGSVSILPARVAAQRVAEAGKPVQSDPTTNCYFGVSADLSGNRLLVGAMLQNLPVQGGGAGYVYDRQPNGTWLQSAKLVASDASLSDGLGRSAALAGDVAILGASDDDPSFDGQGAAYVFERQAGGVWAQVAKLIAPDGDAGDAFGWSVALSPSGTRAAVGAPNDDDVNGGLNRGSAYLYERVGGVWTFVAKIWAPDAAEQDLFGAPLALRDDRVFVGSPLDDDLGNACGAVYVFAFGPAGASGFVQKIVPTTGGGANQAFGAALDVRGNRMVVGATLASESFANQGAAFLFAENGAGAWTQEAKVLASDPHAGDTFGKSVSIDGDRAVIGAPYFDFPATLDFPAGQPNHGQAYLFVRQPGGAWVEADRFASPEAAGSANFGAAVAIEGVRILAGANGQSAAKGAAWVFRDCGPSHYSFGAGTAGCSGTQNLSAFAAEIGSSVFSLRSDHGPKSKLGVILVGDAASASGANPFGLGINLHVDLAASATLLSFDVVSDPQGNSLTPLGVPSNPFLVGLEFYAQIVWAWTSGCSPLPGPYGLSSSRGAAFPILAP